MIATPRFPVAMLPDLLPSLPGWEHSPGLGGDVVVVATDRRLELTEHGSEARGIWRTVDGPRLYAWLDAAALEMQTELF